MNKHFPLFIHSNWITPKYSKIYSYNSINKLYNKSHLNKNSYKSLLFTTKNKSSFYNFYSQINKISSVKSIIINNYASTKTKYDSFNLSPKNSFKSDYIAKNNENYYNYKNKFLSSSTRNNYTNYTKMIKKFPTFDLTKVLGNPHIINNNKIKDNSLKINNFLNYNGLSYSLNSRNNYKTFRKFNSYDDKNKKQYSQNINLYNKNTYNKFYKEIQCYCERNEHNTKNKELNNIFNIISPQIEFSYFGKIKNNDEKNNTLIQRTLSGTVCKKERDSKNEYNNFNINSYNNFENKENIQIIGNNFSGEKTNLSNLKNLNEQQSLFEKCINSLNFNYADNYYNYNYQPQNTISNLNKNQNLITLSIDNNINKEISNNVIKINSQIQEEKFNKSTINKTDKTNKIKNKIINFNTEYPLTRNQIVRKSKSYGIITQKIKSNNNDCSDIQFKEKIKINEEVKKNKENNLNDIEKEKIDQLIKNIINQKYNKDNKNIYRDKNTEQYLSNINRYCEKKSTKNDRNNNMTGAESKSNNSHIDFIRNKQNQTTKYTNVFSHIMPPNNYYN